MIGALDCVSPNNSKITPTESTEVFAIDAYTMSESRRDLESQSNTNTSTRTHSIWWNVLIDIPLLLVVLALVGLYELGVIPSHKAGYFCKDPKLDMPFTGDTISGGLLVSTGLLLPIIFVFITEMFLIDTDFIRRSRAAEAIAKTGVLYRAYAYGLCFNFWIVEVMKGITGMPRPTFFALCAPDTNENCTAGEYISDFKCTSDYSWWTQYDSYHSFPSGHTSLSVYCGFFIAWYLQRRAFNWSSRTVFLVPFLQLLCATYAAACSLTRITDHRHHWWDVLVGVIVGVLTLLFTVLVICGNFSALRKTENYSKTQQSRNLMYGTGRSCPVS